MNTYKTAGITLLETIISLGIISIISLFIFPLMKTAHFMEQSLISQSKFDKQRGSTLEIISKAIKIAQNTKINYIGKKTVKNGVGIFNYNFPLTPQLNKNIFKNSTTSGNTLFLEIPQVLRHDISIQILIFQFLDDNLKIYRGETNGMHIVLDSSTTHTFTKGVTGTFERTKSGIITTLNFKDSSKTLIIRGFESFEKKYKK